MKNEKFEEWFDVAFERAVSSTSIASEDSKKASWNQLQARIQKVQQVRKRRRHMQMASVVAASFIAGAILFSPPTVTKAISPFYQKVVSLGDGIVNIFFGTTDVDIDLNKAKTPPPPLSPTDVSDDNVPVSVLEKATNFDPILENLDDINKKLSFTLPNLNEIPSRYHFKELYLSGYNQDNNDLSDRITLLYSDTDNQILTVHMNKLAANSTFLTTGTDQTVTITLKNGYTANFTAGTTNEISFLYGNLSVRITGLISKEEILKLVESFPAK